MKKIVSLVLALMMLMSSAAFAGSIPMAMEDQLTDVVRDYLDEAEWIYEYDDYVFSLDFSIECDLEEADVNIFVYDDMVSVTVDAPIQVSEEYFENAAIFTTLVNNSIYYAQFRVSYDSGFITCRSCQLVETTVPATDEIDTLLYMPLFYMQTYGNGIKAICEGADPYQAYESCVG